MRLGVGMLVFAAFSLAGSARRRFVEPFNVGVLAVASAGLVGLWLAMQHHANPNHALPQLVVLDVLVLAACLWRRWMTVPVLMFAGTCGLFASWYAAFYAGNELTLCGLAWACFAAFAAFSLAGSAKRRFVEPFNIGVLAAAAVALAAMWLAMQRTAARDTSCCNWPRWTS